MDIIKKLREDKELSELLCDVCDVDILPECKKPEDEKGHLAYSIPGKTFAKQGSGSEYILLEDGSIGFWGSEGEGGRIADSLQDFFEFMIYCPYWTDYIYNITCEDLKMLREFAKETFDELKKEIQKNGIDLLEAQRELMDGLGISKNKDVAGILIRFSRCATREPRLILTFTENDGSTHSGTGSLLDR